MSEPELYTLVELRNGLAVFRPWRGMAGGEEISFRSDLAVQCDSDIALEVGLVVKELEADETDIMFEHVGRARQVSLKLKGGHWHSKSGDVTIDPEDLAAVRRELGVSQQTFANKLSHESFWLLDEPRAVAGLGHFDDVRELFLRAARQEAERKREVESRALQRAAKQRVTYRTDRFFNPYAFVPVPTEAAERSTPVGHLERAPETFSGRIEFSLRAVTPLLLRTDDGASGVPTRSGKAFIPAASVKGALRSLHETITGSCYRVVDLEYVPGYRDVLSADNKRESDGWHLAVVDEVDAITQVPLSFRTCDKEVWVSLEQLTRVLGADGVRTGARIDIHGTVTKGGLGRYEVRGDEQEVVASEDGQYVVLVTDTRARDRKKGTFYVCGRLSGEIVQAEGDAWDIAWANYLAAVDQSDDVGGRKENRPGSGRQDLKSLYTGVTARYGPQARNSVKVQRLRGTDTPPPGYVMWMQTSREGIHALSLAQTWRHPGRGTVRERLPKVFHPCEDAASLCPSCALFGSAPTVRKAQGEVSTAYRGHVRFFDIRATEYEVQQSVQLAPMLAPKPSAGNFYLDSSAVEQKTLAGKGMPSLREWGSELDKPANRGIAGRKAYWHTSLRAVAPRHELTNQHGKDNAGKTSKSADLIKENSRFSGQLVFEAITATQLGSLLALLNPALLGQRPSADLGTDPPTFCFHVGGGRPLGLGSVTLDAGADDPLRVVLDPPGAGRYRGEAATVASADQIREWVREFAGRVPAGVHETWDDLLAMLSLDYVNPDLVRYPSTSRWPEEAKEKPDMSGEKSLGWWKQVGGPASDATGASKATFQVLPRPSEPDPSLPIDPVDGVR